MEMKMSSEGFTAAVWAVAFVALGFCLGLAATGLARPKAAQEVADGYTRRFTLDQRRLYCVDGFEYGNPWLDAMVPLFDPETSLPKKCTEPNKNRSE